jgi:hypothetical protein
MKMGVSETINEGQKPGFGLKYPNFTKDLKQKRLHSAAELNAFEKN